MLCQYYDENITPSQLLTAELVGVVQAQPKTDTK